MTDPTSKKPTQPKAPPQPWLLPLTTWEWYTALPRLVEIADGFDRISLKEMDAVALLNRTDTKFVMSNTQLMKILAGLQKDYRMLAVQGQRLHHYRTLYYDTPSFELFHRHVNGMLNRYKVRSREYTDSGLAFLEVKHKTNKGRTVKKRVRTEALLDRLDPEALNWLQEVFPFDGNRLQPMLWNTFTRMTLVSRRNCERVTLDVDLTFYTEESVIPVDRIAIAEVKRQAASGSDFLRAMRQQRVQRCSFSKYTFGTALLYDEVKKNLLKPKMRTIEKISRGDESDE